MEAYHGDEATQGAQGVRFRTTRWSVVLAARTADTTQAGAALGTLCQTYWYPLYAYARRKGNTPHDAQDLVQGFFASLLKRQFQNAYNPARGKFRTWLLASFNHFCHDEHDRRRALKRGGDKQIISFDAIDAERRYTQEPTENETIEKLYERRWALAVLDQSAQRLEQDFESEGKSELFNKLRIFLKVGENTPCLAETAQALGMSESAVCKSIQRLRERYRKAIRQEIAQTLTDEEDVEEELRHLRASIAS